VPVFNLRRIFLAPAVSAALTLTRQTVMRRTIKTEDFATLVLSSHYTFLETGFFVLPSFLARQLLLFQKTNDTLFAAHLIVH
jgi:hypothetical protein